MKTPPRADQFPKLRSNRAINEEVFRGFYIFFGAKVKIILTSKHMYILSIEVEIWTLPKSDTNRTNY